jgi:hypothetical protein
MMPSLGFILGGASDMFWTRKPQADPQRENVVAFLRELRSHCEGRKLDVTGFPDLEQASTAALVKFADAWSNYVIDSFRLEKGLPWRHVMHRLFYVLRPARMQGEGRGIWRDHSNLYDGFRC